MLNDEEKWNMEILIPAMTPQCKRESHIFYYVVVEKQTCTAFSEYIFICGAYYW